MSVQYMFYNRTISKREILEKTNLLIEHHNGSDWIIGDGNSAMRIITTKTTDEICELENHGFKDVQNILDELVNKLGLLFYTDYTSTQDIKSVVKESMKKYGGYQISDSDFNK